MERFDSSTRDHKRQKTGDGVPPGWRNCPQVGVPIPLNPRNPETTLYIVPFKVPLGQSWDSVVGDKAFTPRMVMDMQQRKGRRLSYVIDLTNSKRYYTPTEFQRFGVQYIKLACRGHGEVPDPRSVNTFVFKLLSMQRQDEPVYVGVHCTHGFNRTGFMVSHALMRLAQPTTLEKVLQTYSEHRPPGIYKKRYVDYLKKYYHEPRTQFVAAPVPDWKLVDGQHEDSGEEDGDEEQIENSGVLGATGENLKHEEQFGEDISDEEAYVIKTDVVYFMKGQKQKYPRFPGAQPVSLAAANISELKDHDYFVTWKADGTRYMVLIVPQGMYFMDRSFRVQRLQIRFPRWTVLEQDGRTRHAIQGQFHDFTLLDGELVVDKEENGLFTRRYLVYDIMFENGRSVMERPFAERFEQITNLVINARREEARLMSKPNARYFYDYDAELVRVRRKHFWDVEQTPIVLQRFSDDLCHETDGLIFQAKDDPYTCGTCERILKWKCATKNSVDFVYRQEEGNPANYQLFLVDRDRGNRQDKNLMPLEGVSLVFPEGENPEDYNNKILECVWDKEAEAWVYQRIRGDKDSPNAYRVYLNILQSIDDNITQEVLVDYIAKHRKAHREELKGN